MPMCPCAACPPPRASVRRAASVTYHFVESIPLGVDLKTNMTIAAALVDLINNAKSTLDIVRVSRSAMRPRRIMRADAPPPSHTQHPHTHNARTASACTMRR